MYVYIHTFNSRKLHPVPKSMKNLSKMVNDAMIMSVLSRCSRKQSLNGPQATDMVRCEHVIVVVNNI